MTLSLPHGKKDHQHTPRSPSHRPLFPGRSGRPLAFHFRADPYQPCNRNVDATNIAGETHQVMHNLKAILSTAGLDFGNVVKTTILLSDMSLFASVNEIYGGYFAGDYPARETYAVKGLPKNVNIEISMVAVIA